jgi:hypothetical protein
VQGRADLVVAVSVLGGFVEEPADASGVVERFRLLAEHGIGDEVDVNLSTVNGDHAASCAVDGVLHPIGGDSVPGTFPAAAVVVREIADW